MLDSDEDRPIESHVHSRPVSPLQADRGELPDYSPRDPNSIRLNSQNNRSSRVSTRLNGENNYSRSVSRSVHRAGWLVLFITIVYVVFASVGWGLTADLMIRPRQLYSFQFVQLCRDSSAEMGDERTGHENCHLPLCICWRPCVSSDGLRALDRSDSDFWRKIY